VGETEGVGEGAGGGVERELRGDEELELGGKRGGEVG